MEKRKLPSAEEIAAMFERCHVKPKIQSAGDVSSKEPCGCAITAIYVNEFPDHNEREHAPYRWCEETFGNSETWSLIAGFDGKHENGDPNDYDGNFHNVHAWLSKLENRIHGTPQFVREAYEIGKATAQLVFAGAVPAIRN
jgi:hypothetical protein